MINISHKKYDANRLIESYRALINDLKPACPYDNIKGSWKKVWSLTSSNGDYLENTKTTRGILLDQECDIPTKAYKYFAYILNEFPDACRTRITVLDGDNYLPTHVDQQLWRFHIPIIPNPNMELIINDESYNINEQGRLYCFDASEPHSVKNPRSQ